MVRDVFLSLKNSTWRSAFTFIKFKYVAEATKVARLTDGMHIYGWPINSKLAKSGWNNRRAMPIKGGRNEAGVNEEVPRNEYKRECSTGSKGVKNDKVRSYTEVVIGDDQRTDTWKKERRIKIDELFWDGSKSEDEWLTKCAIGILKGFADVSSVNYRLNNKGTYFSSSYVGDKYVLWEFDSKGECNFFIKHRFMWDDCFSMMEKWSSSITMKIDLRWIKVREVLLSWWSSEFFIEIGSLIREPLMIDENYLSRRNFVWGRILVLISDMNRCPDKIKMIKGKGKKELVRKKLGVIYDPKAKLVLEKRKIGRSKKVSVTSSSDTDREWDERQAKQIGECSYQRKDAMKSNIVVDLGPLRNGSGPNSTYYQLGL
ncbi:hypothetical protein Dsin_013222 [Dipteronia sinensis]|uniref:DUF4283 domain-containing protein n=1 Tax=Dipteronia sinensis TaxID=43782 RepID=A0AAE0AKU3_9ROSI|nr:hypothetical protein Dsin_013222 [Dipteronia sinensis]